MSNNKLSNSLSLRGRVFVVLIAVLGLASCLGGGGGGDAVATGVPPLVPVVPPPLGAPCPITQTVVSSTATTQLSLAVSRIAGVAPLAVFLDTSGTVSTTTTRPFHELEYQWNFGDAGSGNWAYGSRPNTNSRNTATGPVAAHIYETAGTKTLTVTDSTGSTFNCTITVSDPDVVFATPNTYCFSTAGNFAGCPADVLPAQKITDPTGDFDAAITAYKAPGRRLLFRGGETWTVSVQPVINVAGPGLVGAFGGGKVNVVSTQVDGNAALKFSTAGNPASDWRVMDLSIVSNGTARGIAGFSDNASQITILRVDINNVTQGITFDDGDLTFVFDQIAIVDSTITGVVGAAGNIGAYIGATKLSIMGNLMDNNMLGEHIIRMPYLNKGVISNNTLRRPNATKLVIKLHGPLYSLHPVYTEQVVISDNDINNLSGAVGVVFLTDIGPQNNLRDERIRDVIVERNWFRTGSMVGTAQAVHIAGEKITARNNLVNFTGATGDQTAFFIQRNIGTAVIPNLIDIYHNTVTTPDVTLFNEFRMVRINDTVSTNITIKNNLGYAPAANTPIAVLDAGAAGPVTISSNSSDGQIAGVSPNFTINPPVNPADYKPTAGYAIGGGTAVPVVSDFFLVVQPTPKDIGATVH
jgi:hypothetical protein